MASSVAVSTHTFALENQVRSDFERSVHSANGDIQNIIEVKSGLLFYFSQLKKCIYAEQFEKQIGITSPASSSASTKIQVSMHGVCVYVSVFMSMSNRRINLRNL